MILDIESVQPYQLNGGDFFFKVAYHSWKEKDNFGIR